MEVSAQATGAGMCKQEQYKAEVREKVQLNSISRITTKVISPCLETILNNK